MTRGGIVFDRRVTLGNILSIVGTLVGLAGVWWNLSGEFATAKSNIADLQQQTISIPSISGRLTVVEINQKNGADRGTEVRSALAKMQDQQSLMLQELAAINATLKRQTP